MSVIKYILLINVFTIATFEILFSMPAVTAKFEEVADLTHHEIEWGVELNKKECVVGYITAQIENGKSDFPLVKSLSRQVVDSESLSSNGADFDLFASMHNNHSSNTWRFTNLYKRFNYKRLSNYRLYC